MNNEKNSTAILPVQLVTSKDIGRMLACTSRNVLRLAANGDIPCIRYGKTTVRFDAEKVARHLGLID